MRPDLIEFGFGLPSKLELLEAFKEHEDFVKIRVGVFPKRQEVLIFAAR
jgi:hypothetical protein